MKKLGIIIALIAAVVGIGLLSAHRARHSVVQTTFASITEEETASVYDEDESSTAIEETSVEAKTATTKAKGKTATAKATTAKASGKAATTATAGKEVVASIPQQETATLEPITVRVTEPTVKSQSNDGVTSTQSTVPAPTYYRPGGESRTKADAASATAVVAASNVHVEVETEPVSTVRETSTAAAASAAKESEDATTSCAAVSEPADENAPHEHREEMKGGILYVFCENVTETHKEGNTVYKPF